MKAAILEKNNTPWQIVEKEIPEPKEGQVLIKMHASGLCGTDLHIHHGLMPLHLPAVIGHEPVGEIVKTGDGVTDLKVGDRVGVSWVQRGCGRCAICQGKKPKYCSKAITWKDTGGGMAEYMVAWASGCTLLPKNLSYELAAPLFCAGFTIASGFWNGQPRPGETVGVYGIGGLGHLAIQYAKAKGHRVIAITHQEDKRERAQNLGADEVCIVHDKITKEIASLGGIDLLLHTGNASTLITSLLAAMNPEGRVVIMGIADSPVQAHPLQIIPKQISIIGSSQNKRSDLVDILDITAKGKIKPMVEVYTLDEINHVIERLQQGTVRFRAVITF
jgi:D-arabinose 1-dehydrogenase-like Zn-dependent alcohol dehydrogenase